MTTLRYVASCFGLLAAAVAQADAADPIPAETLVLHAPASGVGAARCAVRSDAWDASMREITLQRSFLDDFASFDPFEGPWTPHFDHGAYDDWRARTLVPNGEAQIYVDPGYAGAGDQPLGLNPFEVRNGVLRITADRTPGSLLPLLENRAFVSGLITSRQSHLQQHGYFEIRARMPEGRGLWPAFWLHRVGQWPPEIDVFEVLAADPESVYVTTHWRQDGEDRHTGCRLPADEAHKKFRLYGVLWTKTDIVFFLDREAVAAIEVKPEMDGPMYMMANLAVGGDWGGPPDQTTPFPSAFEIDWIASWQFEGPPAIP